MPDNNRKSDTPMPLQSHSAVPIEQFQQYRPLLFAIAYRMLGTATDAEDVLQEAYLRLLRSPAETVENPKYYLTTIVTRLCLNVLTSARVQREQYLGPWLPEPVHTAGRPELMNPAEQVTLYDSISIAFLALLESLSPAERAVFLLHEVFDYRFREIGEMLDKSEAACRQLFRRAKKHVVANRPRFEVTPEQHERLLQNFIESVEMGEIDKFLALLAEDVILVPDGGGQRGAAIRLIKGREAAAAFILGTRRLSPADLHYELPLLNGQQAILAYTGDRQPFFVVFIYGERENVHLIHVIAGQKLRGVIDSELA